MTMSVTMNVSSTGTAIAITAFIIGLLSLDRDTLYDLRLAFYLELFGRGVRYDPQTLADLPLTIELLFLCACYLPWNHYTNFSLLPPERDPGLSPGQAQF